MLRVYLRELHLQYQWSNHDVCCHRLAHHSCFYMLRDHVHELHLQHQCWIRASGVNALTGPADSTCCEAACASYTCSTNVNVITFKVSALPTSQSFNPSGLCYSIVADWYIAFTTASYALCVHAIVQSVKALLHSCGVGATGAPFSYIIASCY